MKNKPNNREIKMKIIIDAKTYDWDKKIKKFECVIKPDETSNDIEMCIDGGYYYFDKKTLKLAIETLTG